MRSLIVGAALSMLAVAPAPARAAFHFAVIDEVMSGVGADASVQYVEIRMLLPGQVVVGNTRLTVFSCDGTTQTVLLLVPGPNLKNSGTGVRWIMATPSFAAAACIDPDFTFTPPPAHPGIFPACGMVCWGAPGAVPPAPGSWNPTDPNQYVDCLAYGSYTGPTPTGFTSANASTPGGGTMSLTRTGGSANDSSMYALAAPSPQNDKGETGAFTGAPCPTTTTTTTPAGGSTTTTTIAGGGSPIGVPVSGGGAKTDCFSEWRVVGATGPKPVVRCKDGTAACDTGSGAGCVFRAQLCFGDASNPLYKGKCTATPVTSFAITSPAKDATDTANFAAINAALTAIGASSGSPATFATPPVAGACTAPINLTVPLKTAKSGKTKKGVRTITAAITAGKIDKDKLKLICTP
jgi:hypothetical protein